MPFRSIEDPAKLDQQLRQRAGIVGSGLFLGLVTTALIADEESVTVLGKAE